MFKKYLHNIGINPLGLSPSTRAEIAISHWKRQCDTKRERRKHKKVMKLFDKVAGDILTVHLHKTKSGNVIGVTSPDKRMWISAFQIVDCEENTKKIIKIPVSEYCSLTKVHHFRD